MTSKTNLELAYAPHTRNYVMYLHTDHRLSGPVRMCCPQVFNKDGEFDLNASEWGKRQQQLKEDLHKIVTGENLDDNQLKKKFEILDITDPWSFKGFFAKGLGLGYPYLAHALLEDHNGLLMDNICGTEGNEMVCFVKAAGQVAFVEQYLSTQNKSKPKIVRIVISSQVPKDTISVHPYRKNDFKYIPSYYREDKGIARLPAIIDFPENYRELEPVIPDAHIPTLEELLKAAEDLTGSTAKVSEMSSQ
jgi:hypothetical protein